MVFSREVVLKHFQSLLSKKSQTCYLDFYQMHLKHLLNAIIIKITISSLVIGFKMSYFPLIRLPSCYRTVC